MSKCDNIEMNQFFISKKPTMGFYYNRSATIWKPALYHRFINDWGQYEQQFIKWM